MELRLPCIKPLKLYSVDGNRSIRRSYKSDAKGVKQGYFSFLGTATLSEEMSHSENASAISKRICDFKTHLRFQNASAISKRICDFKTHLRFQNAAAISKRSCDFKTQLRFQDPGYLYCECNRSWIYLGDAYHNKLYTVELRI